MSMKASEYKERLNKFGALAFVPKGRSMWPTLKNEKQSVILLPKKERLKVMDIAFYERKCGTLVLHRIVEVKENGYIFCGDSLKDREFIEEDGVFAVVAGFYKGKKYISTDSEKFYKKSVKLYANEKKRLRRADRYFRYLGVKDTVLRFLRIKRESK